MQSTMLGEMAAGEKIKKEKGERKKRKNCIKRP